MAAVLAGCVQERPWLALALLVSANEHRDCSSAFVGAPLL